MSTKYINYQSPKGIAKYPRLDQPYTYNNAMKRSMPDPNGQYDLQLIMSAKEFAPLKVVLDEAISASGMTPQHLPYKVQVDKDTNKKTDNVEVKFRAYGKRKDGSMNKVFLVDARGRPMPSNFPLTSGSTLKVEGWISVAAMGARLNMRSIQLINLVEKNVFTPEEGFEYDGEPEEETKNNNAQDANNDAIPF